MSSALSALFYLELRQLANHALAVLRRPSRLAMYAVAILYFVLLGWLRAFIGSRPTAPHLAEPYASALLFAALALLAFAAYLAASGNVGSFSGPADARFLIGSRISERVVLTWLQLRRHATRLLRVGFFVLFYAVLFGGRIRFLGVGLCMLAGTILAGALAIPVLQLSQRAGRTPIRFICIACVGAAAVVCAILLASKVSPVAIPLAHAIEHLRAGAAVNALLGGDEVMLGSLWLFTIAMLLASLFSGSDLYPELYASSQRAAINRLRARRGLMLAGEQCYEARSVPSAEHLPLPSGSAATIFWKEYLGFARSPGAQRMFWVCMAVAATVGVFLAYVSGEEHHHVETTALTAAAFSIVNIFILFMTFGTAIALREDLAKPLWWMGRDPLWLRLAAWIAGSSWRLIAYAAVGVATASIVLRLAPLAYIGIPVAIALVVYIRAIGLALYALFPTAVDQRGPLAMLRALLCYALAAPVIVAIAIAGIVFHSGLAAFVVGVISALLLTFLLLAFAAWRIAGSGAAFARAEASA